jgi:hypothetical protein
MVAISSTPPQPEHLIFRQFELPQIHIENCVALYSDGLYEDKSNELANRLGLTNAFERRGLLKNILPKFKNNEERMEQNKLVTKFVHLVPHKHSEMLHHVHCRREIPHYPIRYFVEIGHSGYSIGPHKNCWAKHSGRAEISTTQIIPDGLTSSISFQPLRLERSEDLGIYPLRRCCHSTKFKRKSSTTKGNMDKLIARLHLRRNQPSTADLNGIVIKEEQQQIANVEEILPNGEEEYCQLYRTNQLENMPLKEFIKLENLPKDEAAEFSRSGPLKLASLICAKQQKNEENDENTNKIAEIGEEIVLPELELKRSTEMHSTPIIKHVFLADEPAANLKSETPAADNNKFTAKIFLKPLPLHPLNTSSSKKVIINQLSNQ